MVDVVACVGGEVVGGDDGWWHAWVGLAGCRGIDGRRGGIRRWVGWF